MQHRRQFSVRYKWTKGSRKERGHVPERIIISGIIVCYLKTGKICSKYKSIAYNTVRKLARREVMSHWRHDGRVNVR